MSGFLIYSEQIMEGKQAKPPFMSIDVEDDAVVSVEVDRHGVATYLTERSFGIFGQTDQWESEATLVAAFSGAKGVGRVSLLEI